MSKPVPQHCWRIKMIDQLKQSEDFKLVWATKWKCKQEIARLVRAQRYGFGHIPGTEQPNQVTESEDGKILFGWCNAPVCGHIKITAKIVPYNTRLSKLRDVEQVDQGVGRYGDFGIKETPSRHKETYSGVWGSVTQIL